MPPFVLTVLKIVFLAMLYFFVWRAVRAVAHDLRTAPAAAASAAREPGRAQSRAKAPRSLVVLDERGARTGTHQLEGQLQIGRAEACQVRVEDHYVSQFHARVYPRDGTWYVEDLGSTNGTYLNQRRLTAPSELRAGDRIRVGKTVLEARR